MTSMLNLLLFVLSASLRCVNKLISFGARCLVRERLASGKDLLGDNSLLVSRVSNNF